MKKKWSKKKKIIVAVAGVAVIAVGCSILGGGGGGGGVSLVTTSQVVQKDLAETVTLRAPLEGSETVEVVSNLHYEVTALHVNEGDRVTKGQLLATLNSETLSKEVEAAADALALAEYQLAEKLKQDQTAYTNAGNTLEKAQQQMARSEALYAAGGISQEEYENDRRALREAEAAVSQYAVQKGQVVASASDLKSLDIARKTLENKQADLTECEIISPIDGTVTRVNIKMGRFADDTDDDKPMFVIENLDQLQMKVAVSEYDIAKIAVGQFVDISADILGEDTVSGEVSRISTTGELKAGSANERVVPTIISVTEVNAKLIAGINATAEIEIAKEENALAVPFEAVAFNPDGSAAVYRVTADGIVNIIPVTTGVSSDLEIAVHGEGLAAGDNVIISPDTALLTEGMQVQVRG